MLIKGFIIFMLVAMVASLFAALYFMFTDRGQSTRTVKALTLRIGIWVVLLALLAIASATGIIKPIRGVPPPIERPAS
ncbi:MAG: hypothetical protein DHS20C01_28640 [marine bacterium B5-7]|nr:MAG: hypothetical protein DHS20C01_28640 [marine bacterium B5-7]